MADATDLLARLREVRREIKGFNPDEPRKPDGEWTSGGGSSNEGGSGPHGSSVAGRIAKAALWTAAGVAAFTAASPIGAGALAASLAVPSVTLSGATMIGGAVALALQGAGVIAIVKALTSAAGDGKAAADAADYEKRIASLTDHQRGKFLLELIGNLSDADAVKVAAALKGGKANEVHLLTALRDVRRALKAYSPDEPRDDHGRWTSGGRGGSESRGTTGRVPQNSIRSVGSWLNRASVSEVITGLGVVAAPLVVTAAIRALGANAHSAEGVQKIVANFASRLGLVWEQARTVLANIVNKLIGLARVEAAASTTRTRAPSAILSENRFNRPFAPVRSSNFRFPARGVHVPPETRRSHDDDIDLKAAADASVLTALLAIRDALAAARESQAKGADGLLASVRALRVELEIMPLP